MLSIIDLLACDYNALCTSKMFNIRVISQGEWSEIYIKIYFMYSKELHTLLLIYSIIVL